MIYITNVVFDSDYYPCELTCCSGLDLSINFDRLCGNIVRENLNKSIQVFVFLNLSKVMFNN